MQEVAVYQSSAYLSSNTERGDPAMDDPRERVLDAALAHVPFDGWSEESLRRAARDADMAPAEARALFPRGPVDLALAFHRRGDAEMARRMAEEDREPTRLRDRVARAIWLRLDVADKEAVRRAATLFALPIHAADGARALWETADAIWTAVGDTATDGSWYSKRATLSGVYASVVLYWLGDESMAQQDTRAFINRRIDDVMRVERAKAAVNANPLGRLAMAGPNFVLSRIRKPSRPVSHPGSIGGRP